MAAALADDAGEIRLLVVELVGQRVVAHGFFQRIEIGALDVLDDGDLQRLAVADLEQQNRDLVQAGALRRPPPPLAGDDLVGIDGAGDRAHQDRLENSFFLDGVGELGQLGLGVVPARIARVRPHELDRHAALAAGPLEAPSFPRRRHP